ncbi:rubrerythrin [Deferribacter desulfuricans SSM1]|uniref:Rubrerythrin n=1 Tax=Deferribacter desulfuricans (strain DSM 14783 / JCM 11476 / NBRC 101012 / SSM1) TaxID=639282 RepID=D3P9N2_DEFDS|nr:ferritin family protein [Deferribacter desulfuricans]BAI81422.1 rubrerythrin [Deferribacter desulfuricans SSM1]
MSEITLKEALEDALHKEQMAYEFYMQLHDMLKDLGAKAIIKELASEEVKHKEMIEEAIKTGKIEHIGMETKYYSSDLGISKMVLPQVITDDMSVQDVLRIAMKHEDNSRVFYEKLAEKFAGSEAEEFFRRMAVEEATHRNKIQNIYDDIVYNEN